MFKFSIKAALLAGALSLGVPTVVAAQQVTPQSTIVVTGKYKSDWDKGSKLTRKGQERLAKAQKKLSDANRDVGDANSRRNGSRGEMESARQDFERLTSQPANFGDADSAAKWARQVEKAASAWAEADDRREDHRDNLKSAIKDQERAERDIRRAQEDIGKGQQMIAEAELRSRTSG